MRALALCFMLTAIGTAQAAESGSAPSSGCPLSSPTVSAIDPERADRLSSSELAHVRNQGVLFHQPAGQHPLVSGIKRLAKTNERYAVRQTNTPGERWLAQGGFAFASTGYDSAIDGQLGSFAKRVASYQPRVTALAFNPETLPSGTRVPTPFVQYNATMEIRFAGVQHQGSFNELISAPRVIGTGDGGGVVIPGLPYPIELPNVSVDAVSTKVRVPAGAGLAPADLIPVRPNMASKPNMRDPRVAWPVMRDTFIGIEREHTATRVAWTTMPIEDKNNGLRNWFNNQIRYHAHQQGKPLFDLAALQATRADGTLAVDAQGLVLAEDWRDTQRATMNEAGEERLAKAWWVFLAGIE